MSADFEGDFHRFKLVSLAPNEFFSLRNRRNSYSFNLKTNSFTHHFIPIYRIRSYRIVYLLLIWIDINELEVIQIRVPCLVVINVQNSTAEKRTI